MHGVSSRNATFQPLLFRSAPTAPSLPRQCLRYADGATGGLAPCSGSRGSCCKGAGAARDGPGAARREAHPSIPMLPRRLTVAPLLQPALSASSAVWPAASSHQEAFLFSLSRNATGSTRMTLLALMPSTAADECTRQTCHRACNPLAFCACLSAAPGCAERPLTPAQAAPVCLCCQTSCASARLS